MNRVALLVLFRVERDALHCNATREARGASRSRTLRARELVHEGDAEEDAGDHPGGEQCDL